VAVIFSAGHSVKLRVLPLPSLLNLGKKNRRLWEGMGETWVDQQREIEKGLRRKMKGPTSTHVRFSPTFQPPLRLQQ